MPETATSPFDPDKIRPVEVTAFGKTRTVDLRVYGERAYSVAPVMVGVFPTGRKLHKTSAGFYKRVTVRNGRTFTLRGDTAAVIDGDEYVLSLTLYTHNRNNGRIVAWYDEESMAAYATRQGW